MPVSQTDTLRSIALTALLLVSAVAVGFSGSVAAQESTLDGMDGSGTAEDPYVLTNVDELQAMNQDRDAHYVLGNDIDASETERWNAGSGFEPVGKDQYAEENPIAFTGHFDGQNHTISGLTIDRPGRANAGLFGYSEGTVENVELTDASVSAGYDVGVVVGNNAGNVTNVAASGTVDGQTGIGGIVGSSTGPIVDSHADVTVTSSDGTAGGLAGSIGNEDALVLRSFATGDVSGDGREFGGLVGRMVGGDVRSSFATGDVEGGAQTGGLVGETSQDAAISRTYATGSVAAEWAVGGLVGAVSKDDSVARSYTQSEVTTTDSEEEQYGSVFGRLSTDEVNDIYWNTNDASVDQVTGPDGADNAESASITGLTTDEMTGQAARENMAALNFGPVWTATDEYPVHRWSVENVSFSLADNRIARGDSTDATVTLELADGHTVTATETASYELNNSIASVDAGTVSTSGVGTVNVTASIAGETKTETLRVLEPPNISATAASVDSDLVAQGVEVPIETTVVNTGDIAGEDTVSLRIDGQTTTEVRVSGEPGVEQKVTVVWRPESLGTYDVAVDDASAGTVEVVEPPELTTESASTNVSAVTAGASVPVSVTIANDDRLRGARNATLAVGGETVSRERVSVDAGNATTTALSWTPSEPGTYDLAVDGVDAGSVTVVPADSVSVESVSAPTNATAGEAFSVDATVNNTADVTVSERLRLTAGGETVGTMWADLAANDTTTVTVSAVVNQSGSTTLTAESTGSSSSSTLSVLEPASFAITGLDAPSSATAGESATVTATVANQGGVAGSQTVSLSVDGQQVTSETVELAAGATATVSGDISPPSAGDAQVTAQSADDNRTATMTVEAAATPTATSTPVSGTDTSGGSGPGFGVAAAVVALLAGAALRRRR